jgi:hypothetical protein
MICPHPDCTNTTFHAEKLDTTPDTTELYAVICSHCGEVLGAFDGSMVDRLHQIESKLDLLLRK